MNRTELRVKLDRLEVDVQELRYRLNKGDIPYGEPGDPDPDDQLILASVCAAQNALAPIVKLVTNRS